MGFQNSVRLIRYRDISFSLLNSDESTHYTMNNRNQIRLIKMVGPGCRCIGLRDHMMI